MKRLRRALAMLALGAVVLMLGRLAIHEAAAIVNPLEVTFEADAASRRDLQTEWASPDFQLPPPDRFAAIVERPLFHPSRRPPEKPAVNVALPVREPLRAKLTGLVASGGERTALMALDDGTKLLRVASGDSVQGWRVDRIGETDVQLSRGDDKVVLELGFRFGGSSGAQQ